jgi:hypothetical protein
MAASAPIADRWLYGPKTDVLLGCGLGYGLVLLWDLVAGQGALGPRPIPVVALLALFINTPHYGATLLRVYEHREDRHKYAIFAIHATILIAVAFVAGAHSVLLGSLLFTVYVSWSPWHFSGQNYGLALMLLRRRGVAITPWAKRLIYSSFLLSFALRSSPCTVTLRAGLLSFPPTSRRPSTASCPWASPDSSQQSRFPSWRSPTRSLPWRQGSSCSVPRDCATSYRRPCSWRRRQPGSAFRRC